MCAPLTVGVGVVGDQVGVAVVGTAVVGVGVGTAVVGVGVGAAAPAQLVSGRGEGSPKYRHRTGRAPCHSVVPAYCVGDVTANQCQEERSKVRFLSLRRYSAGTNDRRVCCEYCKVPLSEIPRATDYTPRRLYHTTHTLVCPRLPCTARCVPQILLCENEGVSRTRRGA